MAFIPENSDERHEVKNNSEGLYTKTFIKRKLELSEEERTKAWLAKALVIIFGSTIGSFLLLIGVEIIFPSHLNQAGLKDIVAIILISETGIIGSALGFYFGNQSRP